MRGGCGSSWARSRARRAFTKMSIAPAVRGNIVEFDENDKPRLLMPVPVSERMAPGGSVKIRFDKFKEYMREIGWPDKELYFHV